MKITPEHYMILFFFEKKTKTQKNITGKNKKYLFSYTNKLSLLGILNFFFIKSI